MKSFKILFMLAGLSSVLRASDLPTESYMTQLYTKASDLTAYVAKSGSELGASVAKNASAFGTTVSTKTSEMTTASAKFVEDNQTAVIISATVATTLAITALVRYNMYGYVFYSSAKAEDKN